MEDLLRDEQDLAVVRAGLARLPSSCRELLLALFSHENSSYREVTPMALTITKTDAKTVVTPWLIDYQRFNDPSRNAFFAAEPEIEHKQE